MIVLFGFCEAEVSLNCKNEKCHRYEPGVQSCATVSNPLVLVREKLAPSQRVVAHTENKYSKGLAKIVMGVGLMFDDLIAPPPHTLWSWCA